MPRKVTAKNISLFTIALTVSLSAISHLSAPVEAASAGQQNAPGKIKVVPPPAIHDKWAVLVGVGHYQDSSIKPIKYASRNVLSLTENFCNPDVGRFLPDHVLIATDEKVTRQSLADSTWQNWLTKRALPNDLIVLYICSRFVPTDDASDILLLTNESKIAAKETSATSLSSILGEVRRRTQCKNIVAMLDISPTESVARNFPYGFGTLMQTIAHKSGCAVLCADDRILGSTDDPQGRQSYFAEYIGEGLKAGAGALSFEAIASYLSQTLANLKPEAPGAAVGAGSDSYNSHPLLYPSQENPDLVKVVLGTTIHKPGDISRVKFGKPLSEVAKTDPALAAHLKQLDESLGDGNPTKNLLKAQDQAEADEKAREKEREQEEEEMEEAASGEGADFGPYMATMKKTIQSKWQTPKGLDPKSIVAVFSILKDGRIAEAEIVESSGNAGVDQSALKALADASPLAPLPKGAPRKVQIRYKFDWKVTH